MRLSQGPLMRRRPWALPTAVLTVALVVISTPPVLIHVLFGILEGRFVPFSHLWIFPSSPCVNTHSQGWTFFSGLRSDLLIYVLAQLAPALASGIFQVGSCAVRTSCLVFSSFPESFRRFCPNKTSQAHPVPSALGLGSAESPGACGSVGWKLVFRNVGAWIRSLTGGGRRQTLCVCPRISLVPLI